MSYAVNYSIITLSSLMCIHAHTHAPQYVTGAYTRRMSWHSFRSGNEWEPVWEGFAFMTCRVEENVHRSKILTVWLRWGPALRVCGDVLPRCCARFPDSLQRTTAAVAGDPQEERRTQTHHRRSRTNNQKTSNVSKDAD